MKKNTHLLALGACLASHVATGATLAHRYSFDVGSELVDSVGGNTGVLNNGATTGGGSLILTGLGSSTGANHMGFTNPVDIGGNFGATGVTIESWYTDTGTGTWGKLFQFGNNSAGQEFAYTHTRGNGQQTGVDRDGAKLFGEQIAQNVEHHLVISVSADGNLNTWVDGAQKITDLDTNDLINVSTAFEAIGATSWGDPGMNGEVNEFRIWSGELTSAEVSANLSAGPDSVIPEPSALILALAGGFFTLRRRR
ncbi:MAG: LamG-like jellyroll fold domain-containing protein [Akkermansiaceae bacterium]